jgi:hypothetical protein
LPGFAEYEKNENCAGTRLEMEIVLYDGRTLRTMNGLTLDVVSETEIALAEDAKFSFNGSTVGYRAETGIVFQDVVTGRRCSFECSRETEFELSNSGQYACVYLNSLARFIDTETGSVVQTISVSYRIFSVTFFSPEDAVFRISNRFYGEFFSFPDCVRVWHYDLSNSCIAFSHLRPLYVSISNNTIQIRSTTTGLFISEFTTEYDVPVGRSHIITCEFSIDETVLGLLDDTRNLFIIVNTRTGKVINLISIMETPIRWYFTEDGRTITYVSRTGVYRIPYTPETPLLLFSDRISYAGIQSGNTLM